MLACCCCPTQEKAQTGNNSPGPCNYAVPPSNGPQANSHWRTGSAWGFGTSKRWQEKPQGGFAVPGPGSYCI